MIATRLEIPGLMLLEPKVYQDHRGFFFESYNRRQFEEAVGEGVEFVQDNHSGSVKNVLRGLHYQIKTPQAKLVRVLAGSVFDVVVDLRPDSPTFGRWHGQTLSAASRNQLWLPEGLAHGFLVLSDWAEVLYKTRGGYAPDNERTLLWNDPQLAIAWPGEGRDLILSDKDRRGRSWAETEAELRQFKPRDKGRR